MSHLKQRIENNCLNCNAIVDGKFCSVCGQENIEPAESAWHLVTHFFNDITHFDGKFFSTLKFLILKPGFLSGEYKMGRRASYLNPIRMYVFTSAIFFLIFFSVYHFDNVLSSPQKFNGKTTKLIAAMDSADFSDFTKDINKGVPMSRQQFEYYKDTVSFKNAINFSDGYKTKTEYDSLIKAGKIQDYWLKREMIYKQFEINEKYKSDPNKILNSLVIIFIHNIPQMLFISLPLFALFLMLLYWSRKEFYYASHAIFSIHLYIFIFIDLLLIMLLNKLASMEHLSWLNFVIIFFYIYIFFYMYKAMRNFYGQRRGKTILKFILLNSWNFLIVMILFICFLFLSFLKI